jgi:peroxiredoxin/protein-disulfide isomerase
MNSCERVWNATREPTSPRTSITRIQRGVDVTRVLQPGITAPDFVLPAVNLGRQVSVKEHPGQKVVLVFFPANFDDQLAEQLTKYQAGLSGFEEQDALIWGISDAPEDGLKRLSEDQDIKFGLLSDSEPVGATAKNYGVISPNQLVLPTVFVIDEEGLIRRVYESSQYPNLPNPAMVMRAIKKLTDVPKPAPVTRDDWQSGPPDAPVVLIEYADYQCGPCRGAYRLLKQIVPMYGDKILWIHRHLPLRHSHPLAQQAAEAAEAAGAQGKFWEMHDRLFVADGALEQDQLVKYARELGLDVERFTDDLESQRFRDAVNEDFKAAVRNKIKLPPALFVNGIPLDGPRTKEAICARIDSLLACTPYVDAFSAGSSE